MYVDCLLPNPKLRIAGIAMAELVTLSFEGGDCSGGFPAVTVRLWESQVSHPTKTTGSLPAAPELVACYRSWKLLYVALHQRLDWSGRIKITEADVTNVSVVEFQEVCQRLVRLFNNWLNSDTFRPIDQQLRTHLNPAADVRIVVETSDRLLARLPWHQWQLLEDFHDAEVALSTASYQRSTKVPVNSSQSRIRILAVFGCSEGIDLETDKRYLESLSHQADITFLVEPSLEVLHQHLWKGCHLLFFGGHSSSEGQGVLHLGSGRTLTLEQVKYALKGAIRQGLQLAIFNSCDGLALAHSLAELHIPQVIVMREPVADQVAQTFLKQFLAEFTTGQSLYSSVREGRGQLQALEESFPCASWLPILCQNPAEPPCAWQDWVPDAHLPTVAPVSNNKPEHSRDLAIPSLLAIALGVTALVSGLRWMGWLQTWEFQAFDQLVRLRPEEPPDSRLLVIAVTESDFQLPEQSQRKGSLSDLALQSVLEQILPMKPRSVGLDIYRDFAVSANHPKLAAQLADANHIFTICKVSDSTINHPGIAPPPEIPLERQGFSDIVKDSDDVVRRHLLALNPSPDSPCTTPYGLSAQLALHSLATDGITAQYTPNGNLQIGDVVLPRLRSHPGPYTTTDLWGYQMLLNYRAYRSPQAIAPVVSLEAVLEGQLRPEDVRDRIVLIGVAAESAEDFIATPYQTPTSTRQSVPGVILQAQMVSQILSTVEDGRPLLQIWPLWADIAWMAGWAFVGGGIATAYRMPIRFILVSGFALGLLAAVCFGLLLVGLWVPFVPSAMSIMLTSGTVVLVRRVYFRMNQRV